MFHYAEDSMYAARACSGLSKELGSNGLLSSILGAIDVGYGHVVLNPVRVVMLQKGFGSYVGSRTTPPCSEEVIFFMSLHGGNVPSSKFLCTAYLLVLDFTEIIAL